MQRRILAPLCSVILICTGLSAATDPQLCGTQREAAQQAVQLHLTGQRSRLLELAANGLMPQERPAGRDEGNIAVLDGSDGVFLQRNAFDLTGSTLRLERQAGDGYLMRVRPGNYRPEDAAASDTLDLGDDDAQQRSLPFEFPFYSGTYKSMFVHSDGAISFFQPDVLPAPRDVGRLHAGPARIAPLFADLDPSRAPGSVRVRTTPDAVIVTWLDVPEYSGLGTGPRQTFQVRLERGGSIEMTWVQVTVSASVVGVTPGYLSGELKLASLAESNGLAFSGTVAEPFQFSTSVDIVRVAQRFYETHADMYDYLVMFNTTGTPVAAGVIASATPVRNLRQGIGDTLRDIGWAFGSPLRLQAFLNMGPAAQYPDAPLAPVGSRGRITGDNTLTLLGHEAGHLFLALASVRDPANPNRRPMLGAGLAHWSFDFNSEASLLEGNRIQETSGSGGTLFSTIATVEGYAPLDQYLMGFRAPEDVPPTFLVDPASQPAARLPEVGVRITGTRRDIDVSEIINVEGPRIPDHNIAQRRFSFAFIILAAPGETATPEQIAKVDLYRRNFEEYFHQASGGRAYADTRLRNSLRLSAWPATGVVAGETATASVEVDRPVDRDLVVGIHTTHGHIEAPHEVTIPSGQSGVTFPVRGLSVGVSDMVAEARAGERAPVFSRVQVFPSRSDLKLIVHYTDGPVVLRVAAGTEVNVANVPIRVTAPGTLSWVNGYNTEFRTLPSGLMWMWWTPPPGGGTLEAEIEGLPGTRVTIQAPAR